MKLTLHILKPRNPLVAPSLRRKAGLHRSDRQASRQSAVRALRREVGSMLSRSP